MWEVVPVVLGAGLGVVAGAARRTHVVWLVCGAVAIGIGVGLASGELAHSWAFVLVDSGVALLAAGVARALPLALARRSSDDSERVRQGP
jgi:hypothetical protein